MPKRTDLETILIIGSGPIVIGQACEFDYSGTQACRVLRDEGYRVVLVNSNPATIMTDPEFADATYVEPLDVQSLTRIIERERPDALLPTLGGQTALNLAIELARGRGARPSTTSSSSAPASRPSTPRRTASSSRPRCRRSASPSPARASRTRSTTRWRSASRSATRSSSGRRSSSGGGGTGIADDADELRRVAAHGLATSPVSEILIEQSIAGWKEYELEVMRDHADNVVVICSIENFDAMGVHTGDSITVAPAQTLTDVEYQRTARRGVRVHPAHRRRHRWLQHPVRGEPGQRRHRRHRDEPARLAQQRAREQGDRVPDRQDRGAPRGGLPARRDHERHHRRDAGVVRAHHRLRRHQGAALGVREAAGCVAGARHDDAVGRRGDGDRAHVPREPAEGAALVGDRTRRAQLRSRRARVRRALRRRARAHGRAARHPERPFLLGCGAAAWRVGRAPARGDRDRPVVPRPASSRSGERARGSSGRAPTT